MKRKQIIKGIITVMLSAVMFLSVLPVSAMVTSSIAFSLNLISETDSEVVLSVRFEKHRIMGVLLSVVSNTDNIGKCKSIKVGNAIKNYKKECVYDQSTEVQQFYFASSDYFDELGEIAIFTFEKNTPEKVTHKSFSLVIIDCAPFPHPQVIHNIANVDDDYYNYENLRIDIVDGKGVVTDCKIDAIEFIDIPETFNGYPVTEIADLAFVNCSNIWQVFYSPSITRIGKCAFMNCLRLDAAMLNPSLINIDYGAYMYCTGLCSIEIPKGVKYISDYAFAGCDSLQSVRVPETVVSVGNGAFMGCGTLGDISINDNVLSIGYDAFYNTAYYLNETKWKDKVFYINNHLIEAASDIRGSYEVKSDTKTIANSAFFNCTDLTGVTIPDSVVHIDAEAFAGCTKLKKVKLPNTIETIPDWMFEGCESLSDIKIPESVKHIGLGVFDGTAFYNNAGNWDNGVLYNSNCLIEADIELAGKYKAKDGTRVIADGAFLYCEGITDVELPSSVITIGNGAFQDCLGLKNITMDNSVKEIGNYAFYNCNKLKQITISKSVEYIGENAIGYYGDDSSDFKKTDGLVIICQKDSAAEEYAIEHGFDYQIIGDVSGDKNINSSDALKVLQSSVGSVTLTDSEINLADVNRDKLVNSNDALAILQYTVGIKTEF